MGRVGNVFFAGEACDKKFWGYLQGAFRTGLAQAKVIEDCVKGKECLEYEPKVIWYIINEKEGFIRHPNT